MSACVGYVYDDVFADVTEAEGAYWSFESEYYAAGVADDCVD